jgi:hypoxanthine phosphoribosyltransferase
MTDFPKCRVTTWAEADAWADRLAEQVRTKGRIPETIVALTRGGWVPGRMLADRLIVKRMVSLRAQHWGVTATPSGKAELTEGLSGSVKGQHVLVADDITDTGESLGLAVKHVAEAGAKRVESATFLHISHSKFLPTYHAEEIARDAWVWVIFPWNYWEDLAHLARQAMAEGGTLANATRLLSERCELKVPLADVRQALEIGKGTP